MNTFIGIVVTILFVGLMVWRLVDRIKNASRLTDSGPDF